MVSIREVCCRSRGAGCSTHRQQFADLVLQAWSLRLRLNPGFSHPWADFTAQNNSDIVNYVWWGSVCWYESAAFFSNDCCEEIYFLLYETLDIISRDQSAVLEHFSMVPGQPFSRSLGENNDVFTESMKVYFGTTVSVIVDGDYPNHESYFVNLILVVEAWYLCRSYIETCIGVK